MISSDGVRHLVDSIVYREKMGQLPHVLKGKYPFVTISRETGACGHALALAILEELKRDPDPILSSGWQIADQEICKRVAEDPAVNVSVNSLLAAEYHSEIGDILKELLLGDSPQDMVNERIFHLMRNMATFGRVILVGRGGACLTRDLPLGIHIRVIAPRWSRVQRMIQLLGRSEKEVKEFILEQDKAREKLVKVYFGKNIDDALLYDAVWNTQALSIELLAQLAVTMIKDKLKEAEAPAGTFSHPAPQPAS